MLRCIFKIKLYEVLLLFSIVMNKRQYKKHHERPYNTDILTFVASYPII